MSSLETVPDVVSAELLAQLQAWRPDVSWTDALRGVSSHDLISNIKWASDERQLPLPVWVALGYEQYQPGADEVDLALFESIPNLLDLLDPFDAIVVRGGRLVTADPSQPGLEDLLGRHPDWHEVLVGEPDAVRQALAQTRERLAVRDLTRRAMRVAAEAPEGATSSLAVRQTDVAAILQEIVTIGLNRRASDIHIVPSDTALQVRYRVDGLLYSGPAFPLQVAQQIINKLKIEAGLTIETHHLPQMGRFSTEVGGSLVDLRVTTIPSRWGEAAFVRLLSLSDIYPSISSLGFSERLAVGLRRALASGRGALLVTGPTGSGKTTTLHTLLYELPRDTLNIMSAEDPLEYIIPGVIQQQVDHSRGPSFQEALASFLRADADVIMIGEVRETETASMLMDAAFTGHLVLSSFHATSAVLCPLRMQEMGVQRHLIAAGLTAVLNQRLVRRLCTRCRRPAQPPGDVSWPSEPPAQVWEAAPGGCASCNDTGYAGRIALGELLPVTGEVAGVLTGSASEADLADAAQAAGMVSIWQDGLERVMAGQTSLAEVERVLGHLGTNR